MNLLEAITYIYAHTYENEQIYILKFLKHI